MSTPPQRFAASTAASTDPFPHRLDITTSPPVRSQPAPGPDLTEIRSADLRRLAIERICQMNLKQAEVAWQRRRRDPLEPHGLALLYIQADPGGLPPYRHRLTAATRLWLLDDHAFDVHQRLFRFYQDVAAEIRSGADVRDYADRRDEQMSDDAVYVGLGVSSLDTSTGSWRDVVATASVATTDTREIRRWGRGGVPGRPLTVRMQVADHRDIPGSFRIVLTDGTVIVGERRGRPDFDHRIIHSTDTLDFAAYNSPYPWGLVPRDELTPTRPTPRCCAGWASSTTCAVRPTRSGSTPAGPSGGRWWRRGAHGRSSGLCGRRRARRRSRSP